MSSFSAPSMEDQSPPLVSNTTTITALPMSAPQPPLSPSSKSLRANSSEIEKFGTSFDSMYRPVFPPKSSLPNSLSFTPSTCYSVEDDLHRDFTGDLVDTDRLLYQAQLILECQEIYTHYDLCLSRLHELRKENDSLLRENAELRLALSSPPTIQNLLASNSYTDRSLFSDFRRLSVRDAARDDNICEESVSDISPTSVIENNQFERRNLERISFPKSISVRSSGYLKANQPGTNPGGPSQSSTQPRVPSQLISGSQRVYVPAGGIGGGGAGMTEDEAIEFEVYNQGMLKTELCNKWQEIGACPYGERCRFAHGIKELRPVIRHPRYKTEVCRMVISGGTCPYGHRCHFRHSFTEQDRDDA